MVGRVKALRSGTAKKPSRSTRADFQFPVGRVARNLKSRKYNERPKAGAPVYVVDVIEYLLSKVLELDRNAARDNKKTHIVPHYIQLAIMNDEELSKHLGYVIIASGGVKPYIRDSLLHK